MLLNIWEIDVGERRTKIAWLYGFGGAGRLVVDGQGFRDGDDKVRLDGTFPIVVNLKDGRQASLRPYSKRILGGQKAELQIDDEVIPPVREGTVPGILLSSLGLGVVIQSFQGATLLRGIFGFFGLVMLVFGWWRRRRALRSAGL